ncbi:hypothetical protein EB796_013601 [Bugula neritina]|uniref:PNISR n=1 Tax=Bugula neritina TaxID=10212 RepID=A0A7J7JP41_BUGNE|nr:hypothetical protein EB796_013601 [Bugula neritina]
MDIQRDEETPIADQKSQSFDYNSRAGEYSNTFSPNPSAADTAKEHHNNFSSGQYNQGYEYNQQNYHQQQQQQYWMQNHPGYGQFIGAALASQPSTNQQSQSRPHFQDEDVTGPSPFMDAAKRKALPLWIREGLEKMEREKAKKEERERQARELKKRKKIEEEEQKKAEEEAARTGIPMKSKFEDDDDEEDAPSTASPEKEPSVQARQSRSPQRSVSRSPSPEEERYMTSEERQMQLMMKVKTMLTDILLTVTNEQIEDVCRKVYSRCKSRR